VDCLLFVYYPSDFDKRVFGEKMLALNEQTLTATKTPREMRTAGAYLS
jgi:hypothetical protein